MLGVTQLQKTTVLHLMGNGSIRTEYAGHKTYAHQLFLCASPLFHGIEKQSSSHIASNVTRKILGEFLVYCRSIHSPHSLRPRARCRLDRRRRNLGHKIGGWNFLCTLTPSSSHISLTLYIFFLFFALFLVCTNLY